MGWRRRRRYSSSHDKAAFLLLVGIAAAALIGAYLLVIGAIGLIAWLVRVAMTHKSSASEAPPISVVIPRAVYRVVDLVDESVFTNTIAHRGAAQRVFSAWARDLPKAPHNPLGLLRETSLDHHLIGRLISQIEGRRYVWCSSPSTSKQALGSAPLDPSRLDPWHPPSGLAQSSRYVASCFTCHGEGRVDCQTCRGGGRSQCSDCSGSGKYYGTTANGSYRMLNCKSCRGKGDLKCDGCTRGHVDCDTCAKAKKVELWLEVKCWTRVAVQVESDGAMPVAYIWSQDIYAAESVITLDARAVGSTTRSCEIRGDELPPVSMGDWQRNVWPRFQTQLDVGERVQMQTLTLLHVPSTHVTYTLSGETQKVSFEGLRMLAPPASADVLFAKRSLMLGRLTMVLALLPLGTIVTYVARGAYFATTRPFPFVMGVIAAAATISVLTYAVIWNSTLGRAASKSWALAALAPVTLALVFAFIAEPKVSRAQGYLDANHLDDALAELAALGSSASTTSVWADLHLNQVLDAGSCQTATSFVAEIPVAFPQHSKAEAHANALALQEAEATLNAGQFDLVDERLNCSSPRFRASAAATQLRGKTALASARQCLGSKDWACALERSRNATQFGIAVAASFTSQTMVAIRAAFDENVAAARADRSLEARVGHEGAAIDLWSKYLATTDKPVAVAALEASKLRDDTAYARQLEAMRKRQEAAQREALVVAEREERHRVADEKRQQEREERQAAAAAASFSSGALMCNDGTESPSCTCGGPHRGCCSHHGGISGCR